MYRGEKKREAFLDTLLEMFKNAKFKIGTYSVSSSTSSIEWVRSSDDSSLIEFRQSSLAFNGTSIVGASLLRKVKSCLLKLTTDACREWTELASE